MLEFPIDRQSNGVENRCLDVVEKRPFSLQCKINEAPDKFEIKLTTHEVEAISESDEFIQLSLTSLWRNAPNFAEEMGFTGYKKHVFNSIVADALSAFKNDTQIHYSRDKSKYSSCNQLGYGTVTKAIKFLSDFGYVYDFHIPALSCLELQSFFMPTEALHAKFGAHLENWKGKINPPDWGIEITIRPEMDDIYRGSFKRKKRIKATGDEFKPVHDELREQNAFLAQYEIDFCPSQNNLISTDGNVVSFINAKGNKQPINLAKTFQKRVFLKHKKGDKICYGGRFYGGFWQSLNKKDRALITIDGEPVVQDEPDYSELHPTFAYCLAGAEQPKTAYAGNCDLETEYGDEWRKACKIALLISINAKKLSAAKGALASELIEECPNSHPPIDGDEKNKKSRNLAYKNTHKIIKAVKKHNESIEAFICSDSGIKFQKIDSYIMAEVQRKCREVGIPILGIHDSILFPQSQKKDAERIFFEELEIAKSRLRTQGLSAFGM